MAKIEQWKNVPGYDGHYQVSNRGRVRSVDRIVRRVDGKVVSIAGTILRPAQNGYGYWHVSLSKAGKLRTRKLHRLVAECFLPKPPTPLHEINHKDGQKENNATTNLEWVTAAENIQHAVRMGLHRWAKVRA